MATLSRKAYLYCFCLLGAFLLTACGGGGGGNDEGNSGSSDLDNPFATPPPAPVDPEPVLPVNTDRIPFNDAGNGKVIYDLSGDASAEYTVVTGSRALYSVQREEEVPGSAVGSDNSITLDGQPIGLIYLANPDVLGVLSASEKSSLPPANTAPNGKVAVLAWLDGNTLRYLEVDRNNRLVRSQRSIPGNPVPPKGDPALPPDGNNTPAAALEIQADGTLYAGKASSVSDPNDYYRFTAPLSANFDVNLDAVAADLDLYLYNVNWDLVGQARGSENPDETMRPALVSGQVYLLRVHAYDTGGANVDYTVSVEEYIDTDADNNCCFDSADEIFQGTNTHGDSANQVRDPIDFFTFVVGERALYTFDLAFDGGSNLDIELYDSNRLPIASSSASGGAAERIADEQLEAGQRYYIQIKAISGASDYTITRSSRPVPFDSNNDIGSAVSLSDGVARNSNVHTLDDESDFYTFVATGTSANRFIFELTYGAQRVDLSLLDERGQTIISSTSGSGFESIIRNNLDEGARYYLQVRARNTTSRQSYSVEYRKDRVAQDDGNNSFAQAVTISVPPGRVDSDVDNFDDQVDFYRFTAGAQCQLTDIVLSGSSGLNMTLFDQFEVFMDSGRRFDDLQLDPGQTYYIRVDAGSTTGTQDYEVRISTQTADDGNNDQGEARSLNGEVTSTLGSCDQVDWYTYEASEDSDVTLRVDWNTGGSSVVLEVFQSGTLNLIGDTQQNRDLDLQLDEGDRIDIRVRGGGTGNWEGEYTLDVQASALPPPPPPPPPPDPDPPDDPPDDPSDDSIAGATDVDASEFEQPFLGTPRSITFSGSLANPSPASGDNEDGNDRTDWWAVQLTPQVDPPPPDIPLIDRRCFRVTVDAPLTDLELHTDSDQVTDLNNPRIPGSGVFSPIESGQYYLRVFVEPTTSETDEYDYEVQIERDATGNCTSV